LRRRGFTGKITLLGAERHLPYDRPPLSKQLLRGEAYDPWLSSADDLRALEVTVRFGEPAIGLSVNEQLVLTQDGQIPYDIAVIATGSVPRHIPSLGGAVLRTLEEAYALRAALTPGCRLGIIGAGLIGCEVAASARSMEVHVDLIDVLSGPMIRVVGPEAASLVADLHAKNGVTLHMGTAVLPSGRRALALDNGTTLDVDIVLEAIGADPDTAWLTGSGLRIGDGIECDHDGQAAQNVYGVGDVAQWAGRRHEHWTNVGLQADRVAAAIMCQDRPPPGVPYWWSDQYDVKLQGLGSTTGEDDVKLIKWGPKERTIAMYSRRGQLTGVVGFSAAGAVMRLRGDIAAGTDINEVLDRFALLRYAVRDLPPLSSFDAERGTRITA
jgi:3-phenylpropionate/trans-cinnamate dioxygenase ferredoxin reductase subunit